MYQAYSQNIELFGKLALEVTIELRITELQHLMTEVRERMKEVETLIAKIGESQ